MSYLWQTHLSGSSCSIDQTYHQKARSEILPFIDWTPGNVLDIGCGGGATGRLLMETFPGCRVYGIELNEEAAGSARKSYALVETGNIETDDFATSAIPFADIDTVLLLDVLEHLYNPWQALCRLRERLKPDCRIVASIPNAFNVQLIEELASGHWRYDKWGLLDITHIRFFTEAGMRELFEQTGFGILAINDIPHPEGMLPGSIQRSADSIETCHAIIKSRDDKTRRDLFTIQKVITAQASSAGLPALAKPATPRSLALPATLDPALGRDYLNLVRSCILGLIYDDPGMIPQSGKSSGFQADTRENGRDWPSVSHSMIGNRRMLNVQHLSEHVLARGIPGDLIETGVWRGGACIMMRAVLKAYGVRDRSIWVADSFEGLPPPDPERYPADKGDTHYQYRELAVSIDQVRRNFSRYGLLDKQVRFLKGWFRDTLPGAPIDKLAVMRLDGDMYESTMDALTHLFPKLVPGGFVIIDDYGYIASCRQAVHDYRDAHGISDPIYDIDGIGVFWQNLEPNGFSTEACDPSLAFRHEYKRVPENPAPEAPATAAEPRPAPTDGRKTATATAGGPPAATAGAAPAAPAEPAEDPLLQEQRQRYAEATRMQQEGDLAAAADILIELVSAEAPLWEAYNDLAAIAVQQGELATAEQLLQRAVALAPVPGKACMNLAILQNLDNRPEEALGTLSPLLRHDSVNADALDMVRRIVGTLGPLGPVAWARLLTDLRTPPPALKRLLEQAQEAEQQRQTLASTNQQLNRRLSELRGELELLRVRPRQLEDAWGAIHGLSDEDWLQVLIRSVDTPAYQGFPLPTFPDESLQLGTVGSSNSAALREGYNFFKAVKTVAARHGRPLSPDMRLLDFGTGWGRYARLFLKEFPPANIVGVDVDPSFVEICRGTFPYARFETVQPFPPCQEPAGAFELIIAYSVFSHLSESAAGAWIEEFTRLLSPGGIIAITTQGRTFLDFCEDVRRRGDLSTPWYRNLARSFVDREECARRYDAGEFLYSATGGGDEDVRAASFYGEALIPRAYVERHWTGELELLEFVDDRAYLPQALIVLRKP